MATSCKALPAAASGPDDGRMLTLLAVHSHGFERVKSNLSYHDYRVKPAQSVVLSRASVALFWGDARLEVAERVLATHLAEVRALLHARQQGAAELELF